MAEPYRPSNGTEGMYFEAEWCDKCEKDVWYRKDPDRGTGCIILANALAFDIGDSEYPKEWVYNLYNKPSCSAFTPLKTREEKEKAGFVNMQKRLERAGQLRLF